MSYRITINGESFCSSRAEHASLLDPKVQNEVNKAGSLTFTLLPDHPYYDKIDLRQSIFDVYLNDDLIFEGIAVSVDTDFFGRKTYSCEGELTFLNDTIQRQAVYRNQTTASLLGSYLSVHNSQCDTNKRFSLGSVTVDGGDQIYRYTNFQNTMTEIGEDLIDNFGGYLRVRHSGSTRYLDYLAASPRTSSQEIRIGKNLVDLAQNLSSLDICTVLIPLGAKVADEEEVSGLEKRLTIESVNSGRDYLIGEAVSWYGNIWSTQVWDGVTTASALKTKAQEYLTDAQWANLVIEASAIDLGLTDEDVEQFRVLDMIRVISEPHDLNRLFMLTKLDIDLDHPANTQITLGQDTRLSLSARTIKTSTSLEQAETRILVNASENARQILDSSTDGNIYFRYNDAGKVYEIDFLDSESLDTATRMWRWNLGGWGYSSDGGENYTVAATMDGAIVASMITTGILKSDDGTTFYLDLDNGVLKGNFSELKISGSAAATQSYATSAASSAVSTYDTNLNQLAVFNKLTNNGVTQGIYLNNNKLYVNADYIQTGTLAAARIAAHSIEVSKLTGNIKDSGNTWNIDLDAGTMTIGNLSAGNITAGTITAAITATNLTMNGTGAINLTTSSETNDQIKLNSVKASTTLQPSGLYVENTSSANNPFLKATVNGGGLFFTKTDTDDQLVWLRTTQGFGELRLYNASGERSYMDQRVIRFYDSNGGLLSYLTSNGILHLKNENGYAHALLTSRAANGAGQLQLMSATEDTRVILNDIGLFFYNSSGAERLRIYMNDTSHSIVIAPRQVASW